MAKLTETERQQLRQASIEVRMPSCRWKPVSVRDYLAFAKFASRFASHDQTKPIRTGNHWKL